MILSRRENIPIVTNLIGRVSILSIFLSTELISQNTSHKIPKMI